MRNLSLVANSRLLSILFMGFSSGLPLALTSSTLQAWYTVSGVSVMAISMLTLVGQPYVYKFLWAPFLDRFVPFAYLGRRRSWIFCTQFFLVILIAAMSFMHPSQTPGVLALMALGVSFFSATQDIAINAYSTDLLKPNERGLGSALTVSGYRLAIIISGGLTMIIADQVGWQATYLIMALLLFLSMFVTYFSPEIENSLKAPTSIKEAVIKPFYEFFSRKKAWTILTFIVFYKIGDALALSLGTTFLIRGLGFSLTDIGVIYKTVGILATIFGSFAGGFFMLRSSLFKPLFVFGVLQAVSNLAFMLLAIVGKNYILMVSAIFVENFCSGMATVAFVAFIMSLCNKHYTATQFALLSAFSAVGRVFVGPLAGFMVAYLGWVSFYLWASVLGLPGLILLIRLKSEINPVKEENYKPSVHANAY